MTSPTARLERDTCLVLVISVAGGAAFGGRQWAGGIVGGGILLAISYLALKRGVNGIGPPPPGQEARATTSPWRVVLGLAGRYALLLLAGYVMIGRLHLHPLGVLVGVSAVVVAAMVEAVRSWR